MTTTTEKDVHYDNDRKLILIKDILQVIFPHNEIGYMVPENPQKVLFYLYDKTGQIGLQHQIVWTNNLDFEIWKVTQNNKRIFKHEVTSSQWFKVRDLLSKRFLDVEKLKW